MRHPYTTMHDRAFWNRSVSNRHVSDLADLFENNLIGPDTRVATAGSCFAQHIGRALRQRGLGYLDLEPAPSILTTSEADHLGYGVYSCRYGNIYTARQLVQLFAEAHGYRQPDELLWQKGDRWFDALRPGLQPEGFGAAEEVVVLRQAHLAAVKKMFATADVFVFTLGLTEAWESVSDGTIYPTAPGVIAGRYDPASYRFVNFNYPEIRADLEHFLDMAKAVNPRLRILLTVSPVPLAATASDSHVLVATTYSKSTLRAAAGDLATARPAEVTYFPSYEIITGQPGRHGFYAPDLRNVVQAGVDEVMRHFFAIPAGAGPAERSRTNVEEGHSSQKVDHAGYEHCEEVLLGRL
jgi:hypothetical protein